MTLRPEEATLLRWYLLGATTPDEDAQLEQRLRETEAMREELLLAEEDLLEDYARGALPAGERELCEQNFLITNERRRKLLLMQAAIKYAVSQNAVIPAPALPQAREPVSTPEESPAWSKQLLQSLFYPAWKMIAYTALIISVGIGLWWWRAEPAAGMQAMVALNRAFVAERPLEARITEFGYAPFRSSLQKGGDTSEKVDYVALDRARVLLFSRSANDLAAQHTLGRYYLTQKEFDKAIDQLRQALTQAPADARLHSDLGAALLGKIEQDRLTKAGRSHQDLEACLTHLNRALELMPFLLEALFNRALLRERERLRREAQADWELYLQRDTTSPWAEEARQHIQAIKQELQKVSRQQAHLYEDFLAAWQVGDEARVLQAFSLSYTFNGNYIAGRLIDSLLAAQQNARGEEAERWRQMLALTGKVVEEQTGDRFTADLADYYRRLLPAQTAMLIRARALMSEAYSFYQKSENDCAVSLYEQARQLFLHVGNVAEALFATAWIGQCHHQRGDTPRVLQYFGTLVPDCAARSYYWMQANALCGLANGQEGNGRLSQAVADATQCGRLAAQIGDQTGVIRSMYMRGSFYRTLGRHEDAVRLAQQGLELSDQTAAELRYALSFYQISSRSLAGLGYLTAASAFQQETVRMAEATKSPRLIARAYIHLGQIYERRRRYDEALIAVQRGIAIGRQLGQEKTGQEFVNYGLIHLGHIYREAGRLGEALTAFTQATDFFRQSHRQFYLYPGAKGRLLTFIAQGDDQAAQAELSQVLKLYEDYRREIQEEQSRNSFFDQEQDIYDVAIEFAYTRLQDSQQALRYAELCRSRSLLDISQRGWELVGDINAPELKIEGEAKLVDLDELRRQLPEQVQLVEYAMLAERLIIWVITKTSVRSQVVPITKSDLTTRVKQYLALVNQEPTLGDQHWRGPAQELYQLLVQPVAELLDTDKQLCIIPDKILTLLPFGALILREDGRERVLLEKYTLLYAASANLFLRATARAQEKEGVQQERLLAIGNPHFDEEAFPGLKNLRPAAEEAAGVAAYYPVATTLIGAEAEKEALLRGLRQADVGHFALHYLPDSWSPMLSRMPLAARPGATQRGMLQMQELYGLGALPLRLVVLSACQTRAEAYYSGEGAVGFSRPFEAAGVPLVVASLWPVDAAASRDLMIAFHRARKHTRQSTTNALRSAQQTLLRDSVNYQHPYYWATFITVGGYSQY